MQIKALANTNTARWPNEFAEVYLNNYLTGLEKEDSIGKLNREVIVIKAHNSNKDLERNTYSISILNNIDLAQSLAFVNLLAKSKFCVGARVMLTDNINFSDRLIIQLLQLTT